MATKKKSASKRLSKKGGSRKKSGDFASRAYPGDQIAGPLKKPKKDKKD